MDLSTEADSTVWVMLKYISKEDSWMGFFGKKDVRAKCFLCQKVFSWFSTYIKQNLKRHFHNKHPHHGNQVGTSVVRRRELEGSSSPDNYIIKRAKTGRLSQDDTIRNCVYMAVLEKVPFAHFNSHSFRNLTAIHSFNNDVTINATKVRSWVAQAAAAVRQKIKNEVTGLMVHLKLVKTLDLEHLKRGEQLDPTLQNDDSDVSLASDEQDSDDILDEFVQNRNKGSAEPEQVEQPRVSVRVEKEQQKFLKDKIRRLGHQKKIPIKSDIFKYYEELFSANLIDKECYELVMLVLSAPATQVSVERSFSALAIVMGPHRISLKGEIIDDILVCALNKDLLELVDFSKMQ